MFQLIKDPQTRLKFRIWKQKALSRFLGKKLDIRDSWAETPSQLKDVVDFLNWFDATTSVEDTVARAFRDWKYRFRDNAQFSELRKENALEIGFGGGRLILAACKDFKHVYGVDIHKNFEMTKQFLDAQGAKNYTLLHRDEIASVPAKSIDMIYSFIVFQHFDTFDEVNFYLDAIERVLTKGGYAHIYFGKSSKEGVTITKAEDFQLRDCSLFIDPKAMAELIAKRFNVIEMKENLPRDPEKGTGQSVQASIVFKSA